MYIFGNDCTCYSQCDYIYIYNQFVYSMYNHFQIYIYIFVGRYQITLITTFILIQHPMHVSTVIFLIICSNVHCVISN